MKTTLKYLKWRSEMPASLNKSVPHLRVVVAATVAAVVGYAGFSIWVLHTKDASLIGDTVGTWKSFAILAFGFWLGSSSGGKAQTVEPTDVKVVNDPVDAIPVKENTNNGGSSD